MIPRLLTFLSLAACSGATFTSIAPEEAGLEAASSADAEAGPETDAQGAPDAPDSASDAPADAGADSACAVGVQACDDALAVFCARLKACCAGQCTASWANNGGAECAARFPTAGCGGKAICEASCVSDLQSKACTDVKASPNPSLLSGACAALFQ